MYSIPEDEIKLVLRHAIERKPSVAEITDFKLFLDKNRYAWLRISAKNLYNGAGKIKGVLQADDIISG